jgi:hypothetical protein
MDAAMKLWVADTYGFRHHYDSGFRRVLISYAYVKKNNEAARWIRERGQDGCPPDCEIFLDSGAFGVFTGQAKIDLDRLRGGPTDWGECS